MVCWFLYENIIDSSSSLLFEFSFFSVYCSLLFLSVLQNLLMPMTNRMTMMVVMMATSSDMCTRLSLSLGYAAVSDSRTKLFHDRAIMRLMVPLARLDGLIVTFIVLIYFV